MHSASISADERKSSPLGSHAWQSASSRVPADRLARAAASASAIVVDRVGVLERERERERRVEVRADANRIRRLRQELAEPLGERVGERRERRDHRAAFVVVVPRQLGGEHQHPRPPVRPLERRRAIGCARYATSPATFVGGELLVEQRANRARARAARARAR